MSDVQKFNKLQSMSLFLIQTDLRFIYTAYNNVDTLGGNYFVALMPYLGLITDGAENWVKSYNNSSKQKLQLPLFNKEQQEFFQTLRCTIKLWQNDYNTVYDLLKSLYLESDSYFSSVCKPIAKHLHLYDIFGVYIANNKCCGNTILGNYYVPDYHFTNDNDIKKLIYRMGEFSGGYIGCFSAASPFQATENINCTDKDYGGFIKSPVGNEFSDKFVLFSLLCQINFVIECVEKLIIEEIPTKLRFEYILYYYLNSIIPQINDKLSTNFVIYNQLYSDGFRNAMAHYKMGVALKPSEIVNNDPLFGLTQKYLSCDYYTAKKYVFNTLVDISNQLEEYLNLKGYFNA